MRRVAAFRRALRTSSAHRGGAGAGGAGVMLNSSEGGGESVASGAARDAGCARAAVAHCDFAAVPYPQMQIEKSSSAFIV